MSSLSIDLGHSAIRRAYFRNIRGRLDHGDVRTVLVYDKAYQKAWELYRSDPDRPTGTYHGCPSKPVDLTEDEARRTSSDSHFVRYVLCDLLSTSDDVFGSLSRKGPSGGRDYDRDDHPLWAFWIADCYDPPLYIVQADGFHAAYEDFVDHASKKLGIRITDDELPDYCDLNTLVDQTVPLGTGVSRRKVLEDLTDENFLEVAARFDVRVRPNTTASDVRQALLKQWYEGDFDSDGNPVDASSVDCCSLDLVRLDLKA